MIGSRPGPVLRLIRARMMRRAGIEPPVLARHTIEVGGLVRHYSFVAAPAPDAPLLLVLHGAGSTGLGMAALTGLARRGPAAGFAVCFPDGWGRVWNDRRGAPRLARRERVDDVAFLAALTKRLVAQRVATHDRVSAVGMSNGALLAEHLARHELLSLAGVALVAGSATVNSRQARPMPPAGLQVVVFHGTEDPLVPYDGGPIGPPSSAPNRRLIRTGRRAARGLAAPVEQVATDWAAANRGTTHPSAERLDMPPGDLPATRLTWQGAVPAVTLYRIDGGGHTWPGGAQYLPRRMIGPTARSLDATALILGAFATRD